jgi:hypothetical protein
MLGGTPGAVAGLSASHSSDVPRRASSALSTTAPSGGAGREATSHRRIRLRCCRKMWSPRRLCRRPSGSVRCQEPRHRAVRGSPTTSSPAVYGIPDFIRDSVPSNTLIKGPCPVVESPIGVPVPSPTAIGAILRRFGRLDQASDSDKCRRRSGLAIVSSVASAHLDAGWSAHFHVAACERYASEGSTH